jgi:predicted nucleotidyltransferase
VPPVGAGGEPPRFIRAMAARLMMCGDAQEVLLFGSYGKGQQNRDSDVDLMVIFSEPVTQRLQHELRDLVGSAAIRVDLHAVRRADALAARGDPAGFLGSCLTAAVSLALRPGMTSVLADDIGSLESPSDDLQ